MKKIQKGFTLIELMIVVAIIGILAAIAIPAYQDYVVRSQVSEGLTLAASAKTSVAEFFSDRGEWPANNAALGITTPSQGKYVSDVSVLAGVITITYGNDANAAIGGAVGTTLSLTPRATSNFDVAWICGDRVLGIDVADLAPAPTVQPAVPAGGGTLLDKYRPSNCRV